MSKFFIGQRVRIKWATGNAVHLIGAECRIIGERSLFGIVESWVLDIVDYSTGNNWGAVKESAGDCLEPILDQHEAADDEQFLRDLDAILEREGQHA